MPVDFRSSQRFHPATSPAIEAESGASTERARGQTTLVRALCELDLSTSRQEGRAHLAHYPLDDVAREAVGLVLFLYGCSDEIAALYDWLAPLQGAGAGAPPAVL